MDSEPNKVRGEVKIAIGQKTYVLKPEHGRAVKLDDALPLGVLGTLLQITEERVVKARVLATVVHFLADGRPGIDQVTEEIMTDGVVKAAGVITAVLGAVAAGSSMPGEEVPPSGEATA